MRPTDPLLFSSFRPQVTGNHARLGVTVTITDFTRTRAQDHAPLDSSARTARLRPTRMTAARAPRRFVARHVIRRGNSRVAQQNRHRPHHPTPLATHRPRRPRRPRRPHRPHRPPLHAGKILLPRGYPHSHGRDQARVPFVHHTDRERRTESRGLCAVLR